MLTGMPFSEFSERKKCPCLLGVTTDLSSMRFQSMKKAWKAKRSSRKKKTRKPKTLKGSKWI
jgi:electron transfer flavoprotein alpha/beta subunit